eukprot:snap_masked-scaffold1100_size62683-processed-gene-0.3 protein:Tk09822 transcript:snap_masked-scaffold1100_size62683-processed-gene-0.3-mRNA-1 annotation:"lipoma hmgic fusion partner-like 3 isoform 1"
MQVPLPLQSCGGGFHKWTMVHVWNTARGQFCTSRLYGTYEESRSTLVVVVSRWVFAFLLLHNLTAMASFGTFVAILVPGLTSETTNAILAHRILDEVAFFLIVLAIPVSYVFGVMCYGCCMGRTQGEVEMDKMDKIYQEVWSTNGNQPRKGRNGSVITHTTNVSSNPAPTAQRSTTPASQLNGVGATTGSIGGGSLGGSNLSISRRENNVELTTSEKRKKRESYLEAMSMGSLDERTSGRSSVTRATNVRPERLERGRWKKRLEFVSWEDGVLGSGGGGGHPEYYCECSTVIRMSSRALLDNVSWCW